MITVALQGAFGKPRPALIVQADQFQDAATLTVALVSSDLIEAPLMRLSVMPTPENGLRLPSQIMIDKLMTVSRDKVGKPFGRLDDTSMLAVDRLLALFLGFG
ncbi:mRNA interferase MazF [Hoeflea marina]|uniref:mRNA interferase MazF n=2 Tax=Hoeflea marina TaxID=274592 RepID=A0A317PSU2_9HYPH|nr:mRNA interferase MazF [Hoeflea marina]